MIGGTVFILIAKLRNPYPHDPRCDELIRYLLDQADDLKVHYEYDYTKTNYLRVIDNKGFNYYFYVYEFDNYLYRCTKSSTSEELDERCDLRVGSTVPLASIVMLVEDRA